MILKRTVSRFSMEGSGSPLHGSGVHPQLTSMFIGPDMKIPAECPLGGCTQYESVHHHDGGSDAMKHFQNHMNNTHRVIGILFC